VQLKETKNMKKKFIRADNTYMISTDSTDNPKLGAKILANGTASLFLDYYFGYQTINGVVKKSRKREFLKLYLPQNTKTPNAKQQYKETIELAKTIRFEREQRLKSDTEGYRLKKDRQINFLDYFQAYIDNYHKKDIRMVQIALQRFKDFLKDTPQYNIFQYSIKPQQLNKDMMLRFVDYLKGRSYGEGANGIYARFKKVVKYAVDHDVITKNPCTGISIKVDDNNLKKEVLSPEEIQQMANTHYENENEDIRRAFLFCCYSGLRFVDVKALRYKNIDYANNLLSFDQQKTTGHSSNSWVYIMLNNTLLTLIGTPIEGDREAFIFNLATYESCLKAIKRWVKRAGINKNISWHCARHSFGTNLAYNKISPIVIKSLMGHSSIKYTERYVRAIEQQKEEALNSLPELKI